MNYRPLLLLGLGEAILNSAITNNRKIVLCFYGYFDGYFFSFMDTISR